MKKTERKALLSLTIEKPNYPALTRVRLMLDYDDGDEVSVVELSAEQFTRLLGSDVLPVTVEHLDYKETGS